jgi:hypothetical protein
MVRRLITLYALALTNIADDGTRPTIKCIRCSRWHHRDCVSPQPGMLGYICGSCVPARPESRQGGSQSHYDVDAVDINSQSDPSLKEVLEPAVLPDPAFFLDLDSDPESAFEKAREPALYPGPAHSGPFPDFFAPSNSHLQEPHLQQQRTGNDKCLRSLLY